MMGRELSLWVPRIWHSIGVSGERLRLAAHHGAYACLNTQSSDRQIDLPQAIITILPTDLNFAFICL